MNTGEYLTVNPKDVPEHLKIGQDNFNNAKFDDAIKQFNSILNVAPDNMDARIWLKKAQEAVEKEKGLTFQKVANPKIKELKERPGAQRYCLYCMKGDVSSRVCSRLFQCKSCEFGQGMVDTQKAKLAAKRS